MTVTWVESTLPPVSGMNISPPSDCDQPRTPPPWLAKYDAGTACSVPRSCDWQPLSPHSMTPLTLKVAAASSQYISYWRLPTAPAKKPVTSNTKVLNLILSAACSVRDFFVYLVIRPSALTSVYGVF